MAAPVLAGPHARIWRCDYAAGYRRQGIAPDLAATSAQIGEWLIEAPEAHPVWHSYFLSLMHLRWNGQPGTDPIKFYLPCASHEMWLHALHPEGDRNALVAYGLPATFGAPHVLVPLNFTAQIVELSDRDAIVRIERALQEICNGELSPDTDHLSQWVKRFGNNMMRP
jgi:hypothetical protein